jgi:predicted PurR-regulated permease PerM
MNTILMWVVAIGLGGFFIGLMFYSFYLVLFSNNEQTPVGKFEQKTKPHKNQ